MWSGRNSRPAPSRAARIRWAALHALRTGPGAIAVLAALYGCGAPEWLRQPIHPLGPTLEIVNSSSLVYRVTVGQGFAVQVHPGQHKCVWVGTFHEARTMEVMALASNVAYYTPPENLMGAPGWILEIGLRPKYDVLTLRPAKPCRT